MKTKSVGSTFIHHLSTALGQQEPAKALESARKQTEQSVDFTSFRSQEGVEGPELFSAEMIRFLGLEESRHLIPTGPRKECRNLLLSIGGVDGSPAPQESARHSPHGDRVHRGMKEALGRSNDALVDFLCQGPVLAELFAAQGGGLRQHVSNVFALFTEQWARHHLDQIPPPGDLPIKDVLRLTIALHDVGKPMSQLHQHSMTLPIMERTLRALGVDKASSRLAKALVSHDVIGELLKDSKGSTQAKVSRARHQIQELAASVGMDATDFLRLQLLFFTVDAGSYPDVRQGRFTDQGGKLVIDDPVVRALQQAVADPRRALYQEFLSRLRERGTESYDFTWIRPGGTSWDRNTFNTQSGQQARLYELKTDGEGRQYLAGQVKNIHAVWAPNGKCLLWDVNITNRAAYAEAVRTNSLGAVHQPAPPHDLVPPSLESIGAPDDVVGRTHWALDQWETRTGYRTEALGVLQTMVAEDGAALDQVIGEITHRRLNDLIPFLEDVAQSSSRHRDAARQAVANLAPRPESYVPGLKQMLAQVGAPPAPRTLYHVIRHDQYRAHWRSLLDDTEGAPSASGHAVISQWMGISDRQPGIWTLTSTTDNWYAENLGIQPHELVTLTLKPDMLLFDPSRPEHQELYQRWLAQGHARRGDTFDLFSALENDKNRTLSQALQSEDPKVPSELDFYRELGFAGFLAVMVAKDIERPPVLLNPYALEKVDFPQEA